MTDGLHDPFTNDFSRYIWETTYKYKDEKTIYDTWRRVAKAIASVENTEHQREFWENAFYDMLLDFKITPGGRIVANAGTEYAGTTLINCFVGPRDNFDIDSLEGILKVLHDQALTLKSEGGWGMNFSFIRPRGSYIKGIGVQSPGSVKYMELFDKSSDIITSGPGEENKEQKGKEKIRKGAMMSVLCDWHPDIEEFITAKLKPNYLSKFNLSIYFSDKFMDLLNRIEANEAEDKWDLIFPVTDYEKYKNEWDGNIEKWISNGYPIKVWKTIKATYLWDLVTESTYKRNEPGVLFLDIANKTHLLNYDQNLKIEATNPCQPKWAPILTENGVRPLEEVYIGNKIWSENGWVTVTNKWSTGIKKVYRYRTTAGCFYGTENHKIVSNGKKIEVDNADSIDILGGEFTSSFNIQTQDIIDGLVIGDGYFHKASNNLVVLCIGKDDQDYFNSEIKHLIKEYRPGIGDASYEITTTITHHELDKMPIRVIPDKFMYGDKSKVVGFLRGLYSANGSICGDRISFKTASSKLCEQLQILLSSLGIKSYYTTNKPTKIQWHNGEYESKESYDINITIDRDKFLSIIGFIQEYKTEKLISLVNKTKKNNIGKKTYDIISIDLVSEEEVFDITVDGSNHTYWTGGCNVSNCGEQTLIYGGTCNLLSVNLTQFIKEDYSGFDLEKLKNYLPIAVRFSDNVNDYSNAPLPEYKNNMINKRRIGIGILGWGSALYLLKTKFGSEKAESIKKELMECFTETVVNYSVDLAIEKGMHKGCDPIKCSEHYFWKQIGLSQATINRIAQTGLRNSALFSIQPTGNTSVFANMVSGACEPVFLHKWIRTFILNACPEELVDKCPKYWESDFQPNKYFIEVKEGDETILRYANENGEVFKIDRNRGLTKEALCEDYAVKILKQKNEWDENADWAVTTKDLTVDDHVTDLTGWSKYIDSSISKTTNLSNDYPLDDFRKIYRNAYKCGTLKGITTYREGTMTTVLAEAKKSDKRPRILNCNIHTTKLKGKPYSVLVGLIETNPYEVLVIPDKEFGKHKHGKIIKVKRGYYQLVDTEGKELLFDNITESCSDAEDAITRLVSTCLRHSIPMDYIASQLDKVNGASLHSFAKAISKILSKNYIKDGTKIGGSSCPQCNSVLQYSEGCTFCKNCSWSKC